MLIGYSQPSPITWSIAGSAGVAFINSTQDGLSDGRPTRVCLVQWATTGSPAIGDVARIRADFPSTVVRVVCLIGLNCPAGTKIVAQGKRATDGATYPYNPGGNSAIQRTYQLADGRIACWFVFSDTATALVGLELAIYNDVNGSTSFTAATQLQIGEIAIMPAVDINAQSQWSDDAIDASLNSRTLGGQLNTVKRAFYRRIEMPLTPEDLTRVRGSALANAMNWTKLRAAVSAGKRCIAIPRWKTSAGAIDSDELHATALYGQCTRFEQIGHLGGNYFTSSLGFEEIPPQ